MRTCVFGVVLSLACGAALADDMQVRALAASCASCHGTLGVAVQGMDSLAGVNAEDFQKKMMDFKSGRKPATLMHQISKGYTDAQIGQLAAYFSGLKK